VHKLASIWVIVLKFCTVPPYRLTDFQFLQNGATNLIFPYYLLTYLRMALMSWVMSSCVDKQNVARRRQGFNKDTLELKKDMV